MRTFQCTICKRTIKQITHSYAKCGRCSRQAREGTFPTHLQARRFS